MIFLITKSATGAAHALECDDLDQAADLLADALSDCPDARVTQAGYDVTETVLAMIGVANEDSDDDDWRAQMGWDDAREAMWDRQEGRV